MNKVAKLYKVRKGDTILSICKTHGLTFPEFVALNPQFDEFGVRDPGVIYPGELFVVGFVEVDVLEMARRWKQKEDK
jgi:hypothetical protein